MPDYRQRSREVQPTLYMTLGGIIQSLAFSTLMGLLILPKNAEAFTFDSAADKVFWTRFVIAFVVIVLVWHEYAVGLIYFWWEWDIWDSLVPFTIGAAEFYLIAHVSGTKMSSWLWCMTWVALAGLLSFVNQAVKARRDYESRDAFAIIEKERFAGIASLLLLTLGFAWFAKDTTGVPFTAARHLEWQQRILFISIGMLAYSAWTLGKLRRKLR
jgi:hypothetical protein